MTAKVLCIVLLMLDTLQMGAQPDHSFREIGPDEILTGAQRTELYFPIIQGKRLGLLANQTSTIGRTHLADSLLRSGFSLIRVFCPEHGFRGEAGAGDHVSDSRDPTTGLEVVSLYGQRKKPTPEDLRDIELMIIDIQDVGVRFYTYISSMSYVMEACAAKGIPVLVLDRPNPHGHYIDGPILKTAFSSFVGMHEVPLIHGMTLGEYALMVNGERWLQDRLQCELKVVRISGYTHRDMYQLPIQPSPNLPNMSAVYLYPSLALFEGTNLSVGRGTDVPFQVFGHPGLKEAPFRFTPESRPGVAAHPPHEGVLCKGYELHDFGDRFMQTYRRLYLFWLIETYKELGGPSDYFNPYFDKLAGSDELRTQILTGMSEQQIRESWKPGLDSYRQIRKKYLLYPDFE